MKILKEEKIAHNRINIDKDELYDLYINQELTSKEIANIYNCSSKTIRNWLHRYNIQVRSMGDSVKLERSKWSNEKELQRSKNVHNSWANKTPEELKIIQDKKLRSGKINSPEAIRKAHETRLRNGTSNISKSEIAFYNKLLLIGFSEDDIIHTYLNDSRYPFNCDFYIKSKDLFIEYQGHQTHYIEPFNKNNRKHIELANYYEDKGYDMSTWVKRDPYKLQIAIKNKINLLLVYPKHKTYLIKDGKITTININDIDKI